MQPNDSIHGCSSGGTPCEVSCPPTQSVSSVSTTRFPRAAALRAAATPPVPPPTISMSVFMSVLSQFFNRPPRCARFGRRVMLRHAHGTNHPFGLLSNGCHIERIRTLFRAAADSSWQKRPDFRLACETPANREHTAECAPRPEYPLRSTRYKSVLHQCPTALCLRQNSPTNSWVAHPGLRLGTDTGHAVYLPVKGIGKATAFLNPPRQIFQLH